MITFLSEWRSLVYAALIVLALGRLWGFRRQWRLGVLDYGYNRVEREADPKRFRFWFIADGVLFAIIVLGAANWVAQL